MGENPSHGISIFWQTLLLLLASLVITQVILIGLIIALPQPRPDFLRMSEIADTLAERIMPLHGSADRPTEPVHTSVQARPPIAQGAMTSNDALTRNLATRLGTDDSHVRLFFKPDQSGFFPFARRHPGEVVPTRHGEAMFFNTVIAGYDDGQRWHVLRSAERPMLSEWQRRSILWFSVSLLALVPVAWFFAQRLARPIRRFAEAADRLGRDTNAPPVMVEGPVELRTTAQALNAMQMRIADYLRERTAMIGAIAHDLRTPLARIAFRIENTSDAIRVPVQKDIEQMHQMIIATMDFVKAAAQPKVRVSLHLNDLLQTIIAHEVEMGHDVHISQVTEAQCVGDPLSLQRLFQNLIDNALNFGGAASISLVHIEDHLEITVADRGPGLPEAMLETVFDPFRRNEPSRNRSTGGVGLGLTIARMIAVDHGGTLTLANRAGGGLVATVILPQVGSAIRWAY